MVTRLLDANVLIALFDADHVHHPIVREWFITLEGQFATCPIIEGALTRWIVRIEGRTGAASAPLANCASWPPMPVISSGRTIWRMPMWTGTACLATAR